MRGFILGKVRQVHFTLQSPPSPKCKIDECNMDIFPFYARKGVLRVHGMRCDAMRCDAVECNVML
jgi:hypothetical protein